MKILFVLLMLGSFSVLADQNEFNKPDTVTFTSGPVMPGPVIMHRLMASPVSGIAGSMDFPMSPHSLMSGQLITPSAIMHNQERLNLSRKQSEAIKKEMRKFQSEIVDVQWDMNAATAALRKALSKEQLDTEDALKKVDAVLSAENKLKKMHLSMLIRIRNVLSTEQVKMLRHSTSAIFMGGAHPAAGADMIINEEIHLEP